MLVRPLCESLGVDADRQIRDLKADEFLGPEVSEQTTQVPHQGQARSWVFLLEEYIYGWVASIQLTNTMRPETKASLTAYKRACYDLLYQHFHGRVRQALEQDQEAALVQVKLRAVEQHLDKKL